MTHERGIFDIVGLCTENNILCTIPAHGEYNHRMENLNDSFFGNVCNVVWLFGLFLSGKVSCLARLEID